MIKMQGRRTKALSACLFGAPDEPLRVSAKKPSGRPAQGGPSVNVCGQLLVSRGGLRARRDRRDGCGLVGDVRQRALKSKGEYIVHGLNEMQLHGSPHVLRNFRKVLLIVGRQ